MTTLTVEIDKERDLPVLQALLSRMGLKFEIGEENDWKNLAKAEIDGIEHGLADLQAGRIYADADVKVLIKDKLNLFKANNG